MDEALNQIMNEDLSYLRNQDDIGNKLGERIGAGTYGFVYEYRDDSGEEKVIKILDPKYVECSCRAVNPEIHTTLLNAAHANEEYDWARKVGYTKSPNLMPLIDRFKKTGMDGRPIFFLIMPRLRTIEDLEIAPDREGQIVSILRGCCSGLQVLHQQPGMVEGRNNGMDALVHCDLKPSNIFYKPEKPSDFLIGDYSIVQRITDPIPLPASHNPYCLPGRPEQSSDFFSLGWILFYWMNHKTHPTMQDVADREKGNLKPPPSWGNNPELWDVFLKMTEPLPDKRFKQADEVKTELETALQKRNKRIADANAQKQYDEGKNEGQSETAGLAILIATGWALLKLIFGSDPVPNDGDGRLHGTITKKIPYLGGTFKGTWVHGCPKDGTYTSPNGIKHSGQWIARDNFKEPFLNTGIQYFTGLSLLEKGQETSYQGHARIEWPWGTRFTCDLEAKRIVNGVMTFSDGTQIERDFKYIENQNSVTGILCKEKNGNATGCVRFLVGPEAYIECELVDNLLGPGKIFLPGSITIDHTDTSYENVRSLLITMVNTHSHFQGVWDTSGYPQRGTYAFSNGRTATGDFSFVAGKQYSQCIYTGMIGGDGLPWGVGIARYSDGKRVVGEFSGGSPLKK